MAKNKCKKCGVSLEGFLYNLIAKNLFGVKPSIKDPMICNKCEDGDGQQKKNTCGCGCK